MKQHGTGGGSNYLEHIHDETHPDGRQAAVSIEQLVQQIKETADKLVRDHANRGDVKLLSTAFKELRYAFKVFAPYRGRRKVTVFGSARLRADHPAYVQAVEFSRRMAEAGYMVITGAASGIMEAGHVGAGRESSIGVNILLPFEQSANSIIAGDLKLMHLKYFFTRKLLFVKEGDAVALFPGGFGTLDEGFELLTLIQTGKAPPAPIVLLDVPGGTFWLSWMQVVERELRARGYISPEDVNLFKITDDPSVALAEITGFYRNYHSLRFVEGDLVLRMQQLPSPAQLEAINREFEDILASGVVEATTASKAEIADGDVPDLPRLRMRFARRSYSRLHELINRINEAV